MPSRRGHEEAACQLEYSNMAIRIGSMILNDNVTFLPFKQRLNMSSLIATIVNTNVCLVSLKLFIVRTSFLMCPYSNLYQACNNNYNNNYSFDILICLQPFGKPHLYDILLTRLFVILLITFFVGAIR